MDRLAGKVSAEEVQGMNDAVDGQHRDVGDVVREFRKGEGALRPTADLRG